MPARIGTLRPKNPSMPAQAAVRPARRPARVCPRRLCHRHRPPRRRPEDARAGPRTTASEIQTRNLAQMKPSCGSCSKQRPVHVVVPIAQHAPSRVWTPPAPSSAAAARPSVALSITSSRSWSACLLSSAIHTFRWKSSSSTKSRSGVTMVRAVGAAVAGVFSTPAPHCRRHNTLHHRRRLCRSLAGHPALNLRYPRPCRCYRPTSQPGAEDGYCAPYGVLQVVGNKATPSSMAGIRNTAAANPYV